MDLDEQYKNQWLAEHDNLKSFMYASVYVYIYLSSSTYLFVD